MKYYPLVKYFKYHDLYLTSGTKIVLSDYFINNYEYNNQKIWKKVIYHNSSYRNNKLEHFFTSYNYNVQKYTNYIIIPDNLIEVAIDNISYPIYININDNKNDKNKQIIIAIIYLLSLFVSLIFTQFYMFWILNTIIFLIVKDNLE